MRPINIYTDGSCPKNGDPRSPGGWAYVVIEDASRSLKNQVLKRLEAGGLVGDRSRPNTSIRMEMIAIIKALESVCRPSQILLFSDSSYCIRGINERWYDNWIESGRTSSGTKPKNLDLWEQLIKLVDYHHIAAIHIRGHSGHRWNELCDKYARRQADIALEKAVPCIIEYKEQRAEINTSIHILITDGRDLDV